MDDKPLEKPEDKKATKNFFTEDGLRHNREAMMFLSEFRSAINNIYDKYIEKGYSVKEIAYLGMCEANSLGIAKGLNLR